jgi:hypothetical protein
MEYPATLNNTSHKHGGKIVRITSIGHEAAPPKFGRSQDVWFFKGDVQWRDGGTSRDTEIPPWALCYDGDRSEVDALLADLNDYLLANGDWCDGTKHDGWYANERPVAKRRAGAR